MERIHDSYGTKIALVDEYGGGIKKGGGGAVAEPAAALMRLPGMVPASPAVVSGGRLLDDSFGRFGTPARPPQARRVGHCCCWLGSRKGKCHLVHLLACLDWGQSWLTWL